MTALSEQRRNVKINFIWTVLTLGGELFFFDSLREIYQKNFSALGDAETFIASSLFPSPSSSFYLTQHEGRFADRLPLEVGPTFVTTFFRHIFSIISRFASPKIPAMRVIEQQLTASIASFIRALEH